MDALIVILFCLLSVIGPFAFVFKLIEPVSSKQTKAP
jgi:hypothetical protein